jgi:hypothetical protein
MKFLAGEIKLRSSFLIGTCINTLQHETKKILPQNIDKFSERIKVRLDHKTMIVINKLSSLDVWKKLYPQAKIVA